MCDFEPLYRARRIFVLSPWIPLNGSRLGACRRCSGRHAFFFCFSLPHDTPSGQEQAETMEVLSRQALMSTSPRHSLFWHRREFLIMVRTMVLTFPPTTRRRRRRAETMEALSRQAPRSTPPRPSSFRRRRQWLLMVQWLSPSGTVRTMVITFICLHLTRHPVETHVSSTLVSRSIAGSIPIKVKREALQEALLSFLRTPAASSITQDQRPIRVVLPQYRATLWAQLSTPGENLRPLQ